MTSFLNTAMFKNDVVMRVQGEGGPGICVRSPGPHLWSVWKWKCGYSKGPLGRCCTKLLHFFVIDCTCMRRKTKLQSICIITSISVPYCPLQWATCQLKWSATWNFIEVILEPIYYMIWFVLDSERGDIDQRDFVCSHELAIGTVQTKSLTS